MQDFTRRTDADLGEPLNEATYAIAHKMAEEALGKIRKHINSRHPELYDAASTLLCTWQLYALLNANTQATLAMNSVLNRAGCPSQIVPAELAN